MFDFLLDALIMIVADVLGIKIGKRAAWVFLAVIAGLALVFVFLVLTGLTTS